MDVAYFQQLFAYNAWANKRVIEACEQLSAQQLTQNVGGSFGSLRNLLAHIVDVEWLYLERWRGRAPAGLPKAETYGDVAALTGRFHVVNREFEEPLRSLTAVELSRTIEFRNTKGALYQHALWEMLAHLVNHSTYHRGQVTVLLRDLGAKPNATDMIAFFREQSGQVGAQR